MTCTPQPPPARCQPRRHPPTHLKISPSGSGFGRKVGWHRRGGHCCQAGWVLWDRVARGHGSARCQHPPQAQHRLGTAGTAGWHCLGAAARPVPTMQELKTHIAALACARVPGCPPPDPPPRARSLPARHCDCSAASWRRLESRGCLCFKRPLWKNNPSGKRRRRRRMKGRAHHWPSPQPPCPG